MKDNEIRFWILWSLGIIGLLVSNGRFFTWVAGIVLTIFAFIIKYQKIK